MKGLMYRDLKPESIFIKNPEEDKVHIGFFNFCYDSSH